MEKKVYCGSGKKQNETWLKATINIDKIKDHIEEYKGHKFIRLNINLKDEPDQFGKDVAISLDKWQPQQKTQPHTENFEEDNDLPF